MAELFCLPKLGMDMEEGAVSRWLKHEGETVEKGQALAEIETDKSVVEVESPASGIILKLYCPEGETLPCGEPLAAIGQPGEQPPAPPESAAATPEVAASAAAPASQVTPSPSVVPAPVAPAPAVASETSPASVAPSGARLLSTPRARRLAEKEGLTLAAIPGTGPHGRIVEDDVRAALTCARRPTMARRVAQETVAPFTGVRKITASRMRQSLSEMAQTNTRMEVDMTRAVDFRRQMNARLESAGVKISFMDLLVAVCARALIEHPQANASLLPDGLHLRNFANIGIAADTPRGLMVPVIRDADALTLPEISKRSRELIDKARGGTLQPDEMKGGTFTISNLGMFEVDSFTAIVNPPETCILAVGRIADRPAAEDGKLVVRPTMDLCLSYDHRIIDGAPSARFLQTIKHYLENPVWLLMEGIQ